MGVPLVAIATAAAAAPILLGRAEVQGGADAQTFGLTWSKVQSGSEQSTTVVKTPPTLDAGVLSLPYGLAFFPGETYTFRAEAKVIGSDAEVVGLDFAGLPEGTRRSRTAAETRSRPGTMPRSRSRSAH